MYVHLFLQRSYFGSALLVRVLLQLQLAEIRLQAL
jgi:hypothetical protein